MNNLRKAPSEIRFNTSELDKSQSQEIKRLLGILADLSTAQEEGEFFETSAKLIQSCICLIEQSQFVKETQRINSIPYAKQAVEYALDSLKEYIVDAHSIEYDN